jgi:hypothetical protein
MKPELRTSLEEYAALCRTQMDTYAFNASRAWRKGDYHSAAVNSRKFQAWDTRRRYCLRLLEPSQVEGVSIG